MLFLILTVSCTLNKFDVRTKGRREDLSNAIHNPDSEDSKVILSKINTYTALHKNENGMLPIEEAIEVENLEAIELLINVEPFGYPEKIYEKMIGTRNLAIFKLIPQEQLDYRLLLKIKENEDKELEKEFLKRIEATELEQLIVEGRKEEIKSKDKTWILENYNDERSLTHRRRVNTTEILFIYMEELMEDMIKKLEDEKKDIKDYFLLIASVLGKEEVVKYLLEGNNTDVNKKVDEDRWTTLMLAAQNGHKKVCELLLEEGEQVDTIDKHERTAMMRAAENGHKEVCELLLSRGAQVDSTNGKGWSALMFAAERGHKEVCELLVSRGAQIDTANKHGWTALMFAAQNGHKEVCELLLSRGAQVDSTNGKGWSALMFAAERGHKEVCELLVSRGAQIDTANKHGWTALMFAAQNGHKEICELLIGRGAQIDIANKHRWTVMMLAAQNGHEEVCELLLDIGAQVDTKDEHGWTAIMLAAQNGHKEICELLIGRGAQIDAADEYGWTAIMLAAQNGHKEICELLIGRGAQIDAADEYGWSAIMMAAENGHKEICKLLLSRGAQVDTRDENGWTTIMLAAQNGHKEICELLIEKGAEVNIADNNGYTTLIMAAQNGHKEVCKLLIDRSQDNALIFAAENGHKEVCKLLLSRGTQIDAKNKEGWTALMRAAYVGQKEICKLLLDRGAQIGLKTNRWTAYYKHKKRQELFSTKVYAESEGNELDKNEWTALMFAADNGHEEVCELLLSRGAEIDAKNGEGWTALMFAVERGHEEVCKLLLSKGAEVDAKNDNGARALILGAFNNHKEICKLLLDTKARANAQDNNGITALILAAKNGYKEVCELLLDKGAIVNIADNDGMRALILAAEDGHRELCELLLERGAEVNAADNDGSTALMIAAQNGHKEICELLIEKGAEVNVADKYEGAALIFAVERGHEEVCELLLTRGAKANTTNTRGTQALILAAMHGYGKVCEMLLERGAEIEAANEFGLRALMMAANNGHREVYNLLIEKGAEVNAADNDGSTVLIFAARNGHKEICELLLKRGAEVNAADNDGSTVLIFAARNGHKEICELLLKRGAEVNVADRYGKTALMMAAYNGQKEVCELLLSRGAQIDSIDSNGSTALFTAASAGHIGICNTLLELGASINIKNKKGLSPLMIAAQKQHFSIFTILLEFGAKLGKKDKKLLKNNFIIYNKDILHSLLSSRNFDKVSADYFRAAQFLSIDFLTANFCEIGDMNKKRYIAIHFAAMNKGQSSLMQLITNDTFQDFVNYSSNRNKLSPLRLALKYKLMKNAKVLLSKGASPFYNTFFSKNRNILEEKKELKKYVSSEMLFDLLKNKDLENAQKRIYGPNDPEHSESYKDIIKLDATDNRNRNIFHYLAECVEDVSTSEFLNRAVELDSFSKDLLIQKDNSGARPIHVAILNSNPYFIQHVSCLEILSKHELNSECNSETIFDIVKNKRVSKETIEAIIKYLWKYYEEEGVHSILYSNKNNQQKLASLVSYLNEGNNIHDGKEGDRIIDHIVRTDFLAGIEYVKDSVVDIDNLFLLGVNFSSVHCLDFLKEKVNKEYLKNKINLHDLCAEGKVGSLKIVMEFMKDQLMTRDKGGKIPLQVATEENKHNVVNFLLGYDTTEDKVTNPYFEQEEIEIIREHRDESGHSMMHSAAFALSPHMVRVFTKLGCEMDFTDNNGDRAIDYIIKIDPKNSLERGERLGTIYALLCGMLYEEYDVNYSDESIHMAIKMKEDKLAKELINNGLVNARDREGNTPLHLIVKSDNVELLKQVTIGNINYRARNDKGETALHLARSTKVMGIIFENAINRDISSKVLLKIPNVNGESVLHKFIARSQEEDMDKLIKYVLDNGADKDKVIRKGRNKGKNAIDMARMVTKDKELRSRELGVKSYDEKKNQLLALLEEYQPDTSDMELREERRKEAKDKREEDEKDEKDLNLIFMGGKDINTRLLGSKRYAIHLAVERDDPELIHELVRLGADLNVEDKECITSYRLAIQEDNYESFECLLKLGDVLDVDSSRESVLEFATKKGGIYSEIALKYLACSSYKKERAFFIVTALVSLTAKVGLDGKLVDKIDILLEHLGEDTLILPSGKTLILEIIEANNLSLGILKKIVEKRGIEEFFIKDNKGVSAVGCMILMTEPSYLKEVIKEIEKSDKKVDYKFLDQIIENLEELIKRSRIDHISMILDKYADSFVAKIGKEDQLGKIIYIAARNEKREVVELSLRKLADFTTRRDLAKDELKKRLSEALKKGGATIGKVNPEIGIISHIMGVILKPKKREESKKEVKYIEGIYRDGIWALDMEAEPREELLKYYQETVKSFEEMSPEELENAINSRWAKKKEKAKSVVKDKIGSIEGAYLTKSLLQNSKRKKYLSRPKEDLQGVLQELDRYNKEYMEYKHFIESKIKKIIKEKGKGWSKEIATELKNRYRDILDKRELLKDKIEEYQKGRGQDQSVT